MAIIEKNLEKRNFLNWYCWYATPEDIEKAQRFNRVAVERLTSEYSYEIEEINKLRRFYKFIPQPKRVIEEFHPLSCI